MPLAKALAKTMPTRFYSRQLLVDISELVNGNEQHVARRVLQEWLNNSPEGLRIEPVYATLDQGYRYARSFTLGLLNCPTDILNDELVEYESGDMFLGLAYEVEVTVKHQDFYPLLRDHGVHVEFVIYDNNLSIDLIKQQQAWFDIVIECDGAICKTEQTERFINEWINIHPPERLRSFSNYFQDLSVTECGLDAEKILNYLIKNQCDTKGEKQLRC